ncbi:uncharacterized protein K452DRAFT_307941 [Aplosporella prunicola CBS 121167]|uniref:Uncharacterized protein n=1 Tax=Aplosporella prunicola CBS 121167 TaxID=1176127 RepID=A0A6A6BIA7_9PEZI|nr:uncharacterized protein K452DRAFT_307941 [Aplosporella prunicola CBS 121167]KAF2143065.1 hypothetical protein K452DRAFT_307941 [Aplosporella prunicola CBS 121167]
MARRNGVSSRRTYLVLVDAAVSWWWMASQPKHRARHRVPAAVVVRSSSSGDEKAEVERARRVHVDASRGRPQQVFLDGCVSPVSRRRAAWWCWAIAIIIAWRVGFVFGEKAGGKRAEVDEDDDEVKPGSCVAVIVDSACRPNHHKLRLAKLNSPASTRAVPTLRQPLPPPTCAAGPVTSRDPPPAARRAMEEA